MVLRCFYFACVSFFVFPSSVHFAVRIVPVPNISVHDFQRMPHYRQRHTKDREERKRARGDIYFLLVNYDVLCVNTIPFFIRLLLLLVVDTPFPSSSIVALIEWHLPVVPTLIRA